MQLANTTPYNRIVGATAVPTQQWDIRCDDTGELISDYPTELEAVEAFARMPMEHWQERSVHPHVPGKPDADYRSEIYR